MPEDETSATFSLDVWGFVKENLTVEVVGNNDKMLKVSGERKLEGSLAEPKAFWTPQR